MNDTSYPRRVGEDWVLRRGNQLVVCSRVDMDEWQIQENRKTAIIIDDQVWCLAGKQRIDKGMIHYILDPYSDYSKQLPGRRIRYDEAYVGACKEADQKRKIETRGGSILSPFIWFLGFLSFRTKSFVEQKYGIDVRRATSISLMIEFYIFIFIGLFWWAISVWLYPVIIILFLDLAFRYDSCLREDAEPLGFLEWFFRFLTRKVFGVKSKTSIVR